MLSSSMQSHHLALATCLILACAKELPIQPETVIVVRVADSAPGSSSTQALALTAPDSGSAADSSSTAQHCPPQFDRGDDTCVIGEPQCTYPEGNCVCDGPPACGGAYMPPPMPGELGLRVCAPKRESQLRADGCTYGPPAAGAPCSKPAMTCVYGPCAWSAATAKCTNGHWKITQHHGPGPP